MLKYIKKIEKPIEIDNFVEEYMNNIEKKLELLSNVFRANKKINVDYCCRQVTLNKGNPILEAIKMVSITDLKCIYNFY